MMPPCGTFRYAGVVPATLRGSGRWKLEDQSGAPPLEKFGFLKFWQGPSLRDDRLVGLQPILRISDGFLILKASRWHRAQISSASLEVGPALIEQFRCGDILTLVRTGTADVGVSLVRAGQLVAAMGAVTAVPLGNAVTVRQAGVSTPGERSGRQPDYSVDVSVSGETLRLRAGEKTTIGNYGVSVLRCFEDGEPGELECVAISLNDVCLHEPFVESAKLLARPNAGMLFRKP
jgi:hypothetical protein